MTLLLVRLQIYDCIGIGAWQTVNGMLHQFFNDKLIFFNSNFGFSVSSKFSKNVSFQPHHDKMGNRIDLDEEAHTKTNNFSFAIKWK